MADYNSMYPKSSAVTWGTSLSGAETEMITSDDMKSVAISCLTPEIKMENIKVGEVFNFYEDMILCSRWDVREDWNYTSIILGRNHMFYELSDTYENLVSYTLNAAQDNDKIKQIISGYFESKSIYTLLDDALVMAYKLNLHKVTYNSAEYASVISKAENVNENKIANNDFGKILDRTNVRKFSENHFVISGINLIFSELKVNDDAINTFSRYDNYIFGLGRDNKQVTVIPVTSDTLYGKDYVREKIISKTENTHLLYQLDEGIFSAKVGNLQRETEILTNQLIKELEWAYSGKIITKYIDDLQVGDTITLIDDISSVFGRFRVETFEHTFNENGLITTINVKACVDLTDPVLDDYSNNIMVDLLNDLKDNVSNSNSTALSSNPLIKTIYSYYAKLILQNIMYFTLYHKKNDIWTGGSYEIKDFNLRTTPIPVRIYPYTKKGKLQIPRSLKPGLYITALSPLKTLFEKIYSKVSDLAYNIFKSTKNWALDVGRYIADFLISIPTFGLHELLKAKLGMTLTKAKDATFDNQMELNFEQIKILLDDVDYDNRYGLTKEDDFAIGFFNVQMQQVSNLFPELNNADKVSSNEIIERMDAKESVIRKIVRDSFDISLFVECYDGFKFTHNNTEYNIDTFISNMAYNTHEYTKLPLFTNTHGTENAVSFLGYKALKFFGDEIVSLQRSILSESTSSTGKNYVIPEGEKVRKFIETTINMENYNLYYETEENGRKVTKQFTKLKIAWFHNLYGSDAESIEIRRQNARSIIDFYNSAMKNDENLAVIIMGDFNLEVNNPREYRYNSSAESVNFFNLLSSDSFENRITKATTLKKNGKIDSNRYDNVLVCKSLNKLIGDVSLEVGRFIYPYDKKIQISDHIPVYVIFKNLKKVQVQ